MARNKIKKIIFFYSSIFCERDYKRLGIDLLRNNGFDVEIWEFAPFLFPAVFRNTDKLTLFQDECYKIFYNYKSVIDAIDNVESSTSIVVSVLVDYVYKNYVLYKALTKKKILYCLWMANARPMIEKKDTSLKYSLHNFKKSIYQFLFRNDFFIASPLCILTGGEKSIIYNYKKSNSIKILWAHTLDYDIYLDEIKENINIKNKKKIAVFIDENWPEHPDYLYSNIKPLTTVEAYYPVVNKFFNYIESNYGYEIVIAAHHSADCEKYSRYYAGRKVVKGETCRIIRNTEFSIVSASTAANFSILFNKPCIFITTDDLEKSVWGEFINYYAFLFGKKAININYTFDFNFANEMKVDILKYSEFKNNYIKRVNSPEKYFWQIFADYIKSL